MGRFLITGGTGFVGKVLASALRAGGHEVILATRGRHDVGSNEWVEYDLRDRRTIANITEARPDGIFHLAWSTTPASAEADPAADIETNLAGSVALFQELTGSWNGRLLFVSSGGAVYGSAQELPISEAQPLEPIGTYGMTKASAERYALHFRRYGLDVRIARLANPFGVSQPTARLQGAASIFAKKIIHQEPITIWGDGGVIRDYIDVEDAAHALSAIMDLRMDQIENQTVFNVGSGEGLSLNALLDIIATASKMSPIISYQPERPFDLLANILDISRIKSLTGWRPRRSVQQSISSMVRSLKRDAS